MVSLYVLVAGKWERSSIRKWKINMSEKILNLLPMVMIIGIWAILILVGYYIHKGMNEQEDE